MQKFKTALFGTGFVGRVHLEGIRRLGYVQLYAIGEPQIEKAKQLADEFGVERTEADYHRILEDPAVDAVHICTPNALHFPIAKDALLAGKHVICEKPLATSVAAGPGTGQDRQRNQAAQLHLHNLRFYPMVQHMRRMVEDGDLGDIMVLQGTYSQDWLLYDTDWNWRLDSKFNGPSRCLADIGSHWCDMAEHITGQRITSVCADLATFHKTRKQPKGPIETFAGKTLSPEDYIETADRYRGHGRGGLPHGQRRARRLSPPARFPPAARTACSIEIYGTKCGVMLEPGASRRALDRQSQHQQPDHHQGPVAAQARRQALRRSSRAATAKATTTRFKQIFRRFYQSIEDPDATPEYPQFVDGLRQLTILEAETGKQREARLGGRPAVPGLAVPAGEYASPKSARRRPRASGRTSRGCCASESRCRTAKRWHPRRPHPASRTDGCDLEIDLRHLLAGEPV